MVHLYSWKATTTKREGPPGAAGGGAPGNVEPTPSGAGGSSEWNGNERERVMIMGHLETADGLAILAKAAGLIHEAVWGRHDMGPEIGELIAAADRMEDPDVSELAWTILDAMVAASVFRVDQRPARTGYFVHVAEAAEALSRAHRRPGRSKGHVAEAIRWANAASADGLTLGDEFGRPVAHLRTLANRVAP